MVPNSCTFMRVEASPAISSTSALGWATCAPTAAGKPYQSSWQDFGNGYGGPGGNGGNTGASGTSGGTKAGSGGGGFGGSGGTVKGFCTGGNAQYGGVGGFPDGGPGCLSGGGGDGFGFSFDMGQFGSARQDARPGLVHHGLAGHHLSLACLIS